MGLAFVRSETDESVGSQLWQTIRNSIKVEAPVFTVKTTDVQPSGNTDTSEGVLNGKALALPHPAYPPLARTAHASGMVIVQVTIDEQGNVSAATPFPGTRYCKLRRLRPHDRRSFRRRFWMANQ